MKIARYAPAYLLSAVLALGSVPAIAIADTTAAPEQTSSNAVKASQDGTVRLSTNATTVEVGDSARFQLFTGFAGKGKQYTDATLKVQLPAAIDGTNISFTQDLKDLAIRGVIPAYDAASKTLTYSFATFSDG